MRIGHDTWTLQTDLRWQYRPLYYKHRAVNMIRFKRIRTANRVGLVNPFMPSVPKNGTPSLTANYKIIQALMG